MMAMSLGLGRSGKDDQAASTEDPEEAPPSAPDASEAPAEPAASDAPGASEPPEGATASSVPVQPTASGTPTAYADSGVSPAPAAATPAFSAVWGTPEPADSNDSGEADTSTPETSVAAEDSSVLDSLDSSEAPETSDAAEVTSAPDTVGASEASDAADTPGVAETQAKPGASDESGTAVDAGAAGVSGVSGVSAAGVSDVSNAAEPAADAATPDTAVPEDMGDRPSALGAAVAPGAAGTAAASAEPADEVAGSGAANGRLTVAARLEEAAGDLDGPLLGDVAGLRASWQRIQIGFVDDPGEAVADAADLVELTARALVGALQRRQRLLRGLWDRDRPLDDLGSPLAGSGAEAQPADRPRPAEASVDTEDLRLLIQRYRTMFNEICRP
jgi:hypothetical protein